MRRPSILLAVALLGAIPARAEPVDVVATFSILADMTRAVGGDRVSVTSLVGPGGDAHVFQPSPRQARDVAQADVLVVNGLGFEGWLDRLVDASGFDGAVIVASRDVDPLPAGGDGHGHSSRGRDTNGHDDDDPANDDHHGQDDHGDEDTAGDGRAHGVMDPHAWQDPANAMLYVETIANGLAAVDPDGAAQYRRNADAYRAELTVLDRDARAGFAAVPERHRTILTNHDAFGYLARAYGLRLLAAQGLSTEAEPSARDVAALVRTIRADGVDAVFLESRTDPRLIEQIASETGITPGGELYADTLSPPDGPAPAYLAMMRHNTAMVIGALSAAGEGQ